MILIFNFFEFYIYFYCMCYCWPACVQVHKVCAESLGSRRGQHSLELELWTVVGHHVGVAN